MDRADGRGLLMLGTALFLLALLILAWPQRRAEARLVLPALPTQPTRSRLSLRRTLSDPIAALLNPVVPKNREAEPAVTIAVTSQADVEDDRQTTTVGVVVTEERVVTDESATAVAVTDESAVAVTDESAVVVTGESAVVVTKESPAEPATAEAAGTTSAAVGVPEPQDAADQTAADPTRPVQSAAFAESELDRPALDIDDDGPGPLTLPPLPKLPAIELQFTWAPVAVNEQVNEQVGEQVGERADERADERAGEPQKAEPQKVELQKAATTR
ncbi:hypothetical protein [Dactylosporangium cerinum]